MKKNYFNLFVVVITALTMGPQVLASGKKDLKKQFSTLGDDPALVERVKNLNADQKVRIVQKRAVDRNNRIELSVSYGMNNGADSYIQTQQNSVALQYHLSPRWSFGGEYQKYNNKLTAEGQRQYELAENNPNNGYLFPSVDYPLNSQMGTLSFYPIYGKMNMFDEGVAQFDVYTTVGYGNVNLKSGNSSLMMAGVGLGMWFSSRITARIEGRWNRYTDLVQTTNRQVDVFQAIASLGLFVW